MKKNVSRTNRTNALDAIIIIILLILPIMTFYAILSIQGPSWDITARYLNGKTLLNFIAGGAHKGNAFAGEYSNNLAYYFEPYREPLSTPIFAVIDAVSSDSILVYIILIFVAYAAVVWRLGKELNIDTVTILAAMTGPYAVFFFFVPNGGEGLAVIFVILGIIYLLKKNPVSGLFFGIAVLGKYPALILLPILILLWNKKKFAIAAILAAAPIVAWGVIDWGLYGVPFYSYLASISYANVASAPSYISWSAVIGVIAYPVVFACIGIAAIFACRKRISLFFNYKSYINYKAKVFAVLVVLSLLGYAAILPHNNAFTQARYGFLLAAALMASSAVIMGRAVLTVYKVKYAAAAFAIAVLLGYLVYSSFILNTAQLKYYNPGNKASIYAYSENVLSSFGFNNCRVVSNAWIPMLYSGYDAYSPYIFYGDMEQEHYPVVVFNYTGVSMGSTRYLPLLKNDTKAYSGANFTIYLPKEASCYNYTEQ